MRTARRDQARLSPQKKKGKSNKKEEKRSKKEKKTTPAARRWRLNGRRLAEYWRRLSDDVVRTSAKLRHERRRPHPLRRPVDNTHTHTHTHTHTYTPSPDTLTPHMTHPSAIRGTKSLCLTLYKYM